MIKNNDKILTIGLPCYNEEYSLDANLNNLCKIILKNNFENEVSVLVSNNCSTDKTESICQRYYSLYPNIFTYVSNKTNIGVDRNVHNVIMCSKSQYVWILSGNDSIAEGALFRVLAYVRRYKPSYIFVNFIPDTTLVNDHDVCCDKETFIRSLKWRCSLISSNIVRKDLWLSFNMEKYFDSMWIHMGYIIELLNHFVQNAIVSNEIDIIPDICSQGNTWDKNGNLLLYGLGLFKMTDKYLLDKTSIAYELGQRSMSVGYPGTIIHARKQGLKITKDIRSTIKKAMSYNKKKYLFMCLPVIICPEFLFHFINALFSLKIRIKVKIKKILFNKLAKKIYHYILSKPVGNVILKVMHYGYYLISPRIRKNPEIITIIDGGLGSQMGQYAMGQEIQRITGKQVSYDLSWYERDGGGKDINGKETRFYELENVFPTIKVGRAGTIKALLYKKLFNKYKSNNLINNLDELDLSKPPVYLGGYWRTTKYSNYDIDSLRRMFTFTLKLDDKNRDLFDKINSCTCSVAVQIRMGDYLGSVLDVTAPGYFYNAINYLFKERQLGKSHFFVFSDDIAKSKEMLAVLPYQFTFADINDNAHGAYDMYLMSQCHHFIISNSTFGFWPALLSERTDEKIVIQPSKWLKTDTERTEPRYPGWISMDC